MDEPEEQATDAITAPEADFHAEALRRFGAIAEAQQEERALNLQDRRFATIAGAQWEDQWGDQWENSIKVEVNKTAMGAERIIADYRAHRMIVNFRGVDKGADEETADLLDGMFRADHYRSKGQQATDNAFEEAVLGGQGAWRLTTSYVDPYDPEDDRQQIDFRMIPDADQSVFWDMDAVLYDKSDAKFCFVVTAMSPEAYKAQYKDDPESWDTSLRKPFYDWYTPNVVKVAEYYVVEEKKQKLYVLRHSATEEERREWVADLNDGELEELRVQGWEPMRERMIPRRSVRKFILSAGGILGKKVGQVLAGDQIPIIPVYGKRWFVDNMERTRGHVRLAKDGQRIYNANLAKLVETASYSPVSRPIFTPGQVAGHEQSWADANINRQAYSLLNPIIGPNGEEVPQGPIGMVAPPDLPPALPALIQITASDIQELTAADDGADKVRSNVSAEAMDIAATRTDQRSFTYIDNMKQSWQRCGEVWLSMARDVYVEDEREVDTVGLDGEQGSETLRKLGTSEKGVFGLQNDIQRGRYKVISDVTEATATRRDKTVKTLLNGAQVIAGFDPELASAMTVTATMNMDGEGITDLQDWLRQRAIRSGLAKPTDDEREALQQEAANQKPDPQAQAMEAQAAAFAADAAKQTELAEKAKADTALSLAKTEETMAKTAKTEAETEEKRRNGFVERVRGVFGGGQKRADPGGNRPQA